jgi:hypothetical protein
MGFKKDFFIDCVGAVTILTDSRVVFQGQIVKDERHHDDLTVVVENDPIFIVLRLTCDPALLRDNARIEEIEPDLFFAGDVIRINVNDIIAVGPSRECFDDDPKKNS